MRHEKIEALRKAIAELPPGTRERPAYNALCPPAAKGEAMPFAEFRKLWMERVKAQRAAVDASPTPEAVDS